MLSSFLRMLLAFVLFQVVREVIRAFTRPSRDAGQFRPPPPPPPRTPRIHIDRQNIVDATFDEVKQQQGR